jgi:hypothetical protein
MSRSLSIVSAEDRVDRVCFNPQVEWTDHVIHVGAYTCPRCATEFEFNTGTLRHFERSERSPLGPDWERQCLAARPLGPWEWALDFRCRGCDAPVRLVYAHDGEYAMGAWKYRVLQALEGVEEEQPRNAG